MGGTARVLEIAEEEAAEPHLDEARPQMSVKYIGRGGVLVDVAAPMESPPLGATAGGSCSLARAAGLGIAASCSDCAE